MPHSEGVEAGIYHRYHNRNCSSGHVWITKRRHGEFIKLMAGPEGAEIVADSGSIGCEDGSGY